MGSHSYNIPKKKKAKEKETKKEVKADGSDSGK